MIKINLALSESLISGSSDSSFPDGSAQIARQQGLTKLVMILLFPAALYAYEFVTLPDLQSNLRRINAEVATLQAVNQSANVARENLNRYQQEKETLQKLITSLESLKADRLQEVKILDLLQRVIPDKAWLTTVDFKTSSIKIEGLSVNRSDINNFVEALSQSIFLANVIMINTREVTDPRGVFFSFTVNASLPEAIKSEEAL
jgi:type IV pilus assembly protein PilN